MKGDNARRGGNLGKFLGNIFGNDVQDDLIFKQDDDLRGN